MGLKGFYRFVHPQYKSKTALKKKLDIYVYVQSRLYSILLRNICIYSASSRSLSDKRYEGFIIQYFSPVFLISDFLVGTLVPKQRYCSPGHIQYQHRYLQLLSLQKAH